MNQLSNNKNLRDQSGFGLIEVIIALFILGLVVSALAPIMKSNVWGVENTLARNSARFKAERMLDSLQVAGIHMVTADTAVTSGNCNEAGIDKRNFTCTYTSATMDEYEGVVVAKTVSVTVSWDITGVTKSLTVEGVVQ